MRWLLFALIAVVAVGAGVGLAVAGGDDSADDGGSDTKAEPLATPLADVDTATMVVNRESFCADIHPDDVAEALGGEPQRAASYQNGDPARLTPTLRDVAHEYACSWIGEGGTAAAAWVFAPPVTPQGARNLIADVPSRCRAIEAPAYGSPSDALLCDNGRSVTFRGLFGGAWLTCQLTGTRGEEQQPLVDRAGRWCVAVAQAAG